MEKENEPPPGTDTGTGSGSGVSVRDSGDSDHESLRHISRGFSVKDVWSRVSDGVSHVTATPELQSRLSSVIAGALVGVFVVMRTVSYVGMIFTGPVLLSYFSAGLTQFLFSGLISQAVYLKRGLFPFVIYGSSSTVAPFLASMASAMVDSSTSGDYSPETVRNTLFVALSLCGLLTGAAFWLLGRMRAGRFLQFFPYPVSRGFFAALGLQMLLSAWNLAVGFTITTGNVSTIWTGTRIGQLLAATGFGCFLKFVRSVQTKPLQFPISMCGVFVLFYIIVGISGATMDGLHAAGWLIRVTSAADASGDSFYSFWSYLDFTRVSGLLLLKQSVSIGGLLLLCTFDIALTLPGLQDLTADDDTQSDVDFDAELKQNGECCMVGSILGGGGVSYATLSPSKINVDAGGGRNRIAAVASLIVSLIAFFSGPQMVGIMPAFFVGGILFYAGIGYIIEGVWDPRKVMPKREYAMTWVIVAFSFFFSMTEAVGLGLALACFTFIWRYSSSPFVRSVHHPHHLNSPGGGMGVSSRALNSASSSSLAVHHSEITIMHLQGYLFFGSVENVAMQFRKLLVQSQRRAHHTRQSVAPTATLKALVLDFRLVFGVDASAVETLSRLKRFAVQQKVALVVSGLVRHNDVRRDLRENSVLLNGIKVVDTIDEAIDWAESEILSLRASEADAAAANGSGELTSPPTNGNGHSHSIEMTGASTTPPLAARTIATPATPLSPQRQALHELAKSVFVTKLRAALPASAYTSTTALASRIQTLFPQSYVMAFPPQHPIRQLRHNRQFVYFIERGSVNLTVTFVDTYAVGDAATALRTLLNRSPSIQHANRSAHASPAITLPPSGETDSAPVIRLDSNAAVPLSGPTTRPVLQLPTGAVSISIAAPLSSKHARGGSGTPTARTAAALAAATAAAESKPDSGPVVLPPSAAAAAAATAAAAVDDLKAPSVFSDEFPPTPLSRLGSTEDTSAPNTVRHANGSGPASVAGGSVRPALAREKNGCVVATLEAGDFVNERAYLHPQPAAAVAPATAADEKSPAAVAAAAFSAGAGGVRDHITPIAATECLVRALSVADLRAIEHSDPAFALCLNRLLTESIVNRFHSATDILVNSID